MKFIGKSSISHKKTQEIENFNPFKGGLKQVATAEQRAVHFSYLQAASINSYT
jgi:hypothetical protein